MKQDNCVKIESLNYPVYFGPEIWNEIEVFIQPFLNSGGIYILTDHHTRDFCLPVLESYLPVFSGQPSWSVVPGEDSKDPANLEKIWLWLMESGASRESLLVNLGGGVVTDLGGFAAATFKRGICCINIPTSLIGQADAAVGGKTGINVSGIKNQAGLFCDPSAVFINPLFLATLPEDHFRSGFAEIIKCAALSGKESWEKLENKDNDTKHLFNLILETVKYKCGIVSLDPFDQSERKILNFGHTVGHALESFYTMPAGIGISHGEAVAAGMICEAFISFEIAGLPNSELEEISSVIQAHFDLKPIVNEHFDSIIVLMDHDKKKTASGIGFSLLENIGKPVSGRFVDRAGVARSFEYYNQKVERDKNYKR